jgi:hypothetical protein
MRFETWCSLSEDELAKRDVAELNLAAAFGLPEAGQVDVVGLRHKLDEWAGIIERATDRLLPRFRERPGEQADTEAQFRMLVFFTILQRDLGVSYNFDFLHGRWDPTDSRNLFIHGPLTGQGGTCISLPALYIAIGRRLGYPMRMVLAKGHTFCRWDDPRGDRFNIEATSLGFAPRTDNHYRSWPRPITDADLASGQYLRNLSPHEELAYFLAYRGYCCLYHLDTVGAMDAFCHAARLWPPHFEAPRVVSILIHRAVEQAAETSTGRNALHIPAPCDECERQMYRHAQAQLNEILALRSEKRRRAAADATFDCLPDVGGNALTTILTL